MKKFFQLIFILMTLTILLTSCNQTKFNSEEWRNWEESEVDLSLRWDMTEDLIDEYDLKGMSIEQVIKLLGQPDKKTKKQLEYFLGHTREGINMGYLILTIENNTITEYIIYNG
ncbi:hypothetical protein V9L05_19445 [Bernardetia sp. Wsw4-3y2]|uniref:hypothetical protein n=1 Tax=Bernardetia sp. Wsw4-3y2 TaxID=3127471 RepID=UPI0030CAF504